MGDRLYLERFVWFDGQIRKNSFPNATSLVKEYGFSRKTAQNTIDYFRDRYGAPLHYDQSRRGYVYTDPDYTLPVTRLTEAELMALMASHKLLSDAAAGPLEKELAGITTKLGRLLSDGLPSPVDPEQAFSLRWQGFSPGDPLVFQQVATALLSSRLLSFCYYSPATSQCTMRSVEPHHMINYMGDWHLIAFCHLRGQWRDFNLARVTMISVEDEQFARRDENQWRPHLDGTFGIFQNRRNYPVTIRFSAERARWVRDEIWHPDQQRVAHEDGSLEITLPVSHEAEILGEVLRHGCHAEIIEPLWLREKAREEISLMMKKYWDMGT